MDSMDYEMTVLKAKYEDMRKSREDIHSQVGVLNCFQGWISGFANMPRAYRSYPQACKLMLLHAW